MKLPRDVSGASLAKALAVLGDRATRQSGSHIRLTCEQPAQHHVTIPKAAAPAKPWERLRAAGGRLLAAPGESAVEDGDFDAMR